MQSVSPARAGGRGLKAAIGGLGRAYIAAVVTGRWFIIGGWVVVTVLLSAALPTEAGESSGTFGDLLPPDSAAVRVQDRSLEQFAVPVLSETSVVVHDPAGLDPLTRADVVLWALAHVQASEQGLVPDERNQIVAAIPIPTATPQTAVTYLYFSGGTLLSPAVELAEGYAAHFHNQKSIQTFVTGITPAQLRQGHYLLERLHLFELATLGMIAVVVGIALRSFVAPIAVLTVAGFGYLVAVRLLGVLSTSLGVGLPDQLRPLLAALLIGVVTDYCVLFFFGFRDQLKRGLPRLEAARHAVAVESPIIAVAGLTVAAGTAALVAANFSLFKAFGPAMALTVLVGVVVSLTLVPALMAILGHRLFLPWKEQEQLAVQRPRTARRTSRFIKIVATRRGALAATGIVVGLLVLAALPLSQMRLDMSFTSGLPADDPVQRGADVLDGSAIRGVTAPTEIIVEGKNLIRQRESLDRMQNAIAAEPGVATVLGPAQNPLPDPYGIVFSRDGNTARFVVILDSDPLAAPAIGHLQRLESRLDALARDSGLRDVDVAVTGQTAIAAELAAITRDNLWITLLAALAVELVILIIYLRAVAAPVVLLASSVLGVAAALGLTVLVFQGVRGDPGLTFYAPFATAVLLLALGSDYNVFTVGSIWHQASRYPLSTAIARAMPATNRAVGTAGVILAATFAMVAIISLETFRQIAFTMTIGLLIDTFMIRPVLTPALLTLLGPAAGWPSKRIRTSPVPHSQLHEHASSAARRPTSALRAVDSDLDDPEPAEAALP